MMNDCGGTLLLVNVDSQNPDKGKGRKGLISQVEKLSNNEIMISQPNQSP